MKSVSAQRSSGFSESTNDGIGVPLRPVLKVRKMSSRVGPPRKVQRSREVGGADRVAPVVLQRRRRGAVAAPELAVAAHAAERRVELLAPSPTVSFEDVGAAREGSIGFGGLAGRRSPA